MTFEPLMKDAKVIYVAFKRCVFDLFYSWHNTCHAIQTNFSLPSIFVNCLFVCQNLFLVIHNIFLIFTIYL